MYLIDDLREVHPLELIFRLMITGVGLLLLGFAGWMTVSNLIIIGTYEKPYAEVVSFLEDRTGFIEGTGQL